MSSELLSGGAALGDRFVAELGSPDGWTPTLFGDGLGDVLAAVGAARGTGSTAVAGALLMEQYAQRLVAPALAALFRDGDVLGTAGVRALIVDGSLRRLAFPHAPVPGDPATATGIVREGLLAALEPAAEAVHRRTRVGMRVLRGAIANAVASSALHLSWPGADRARYAHTARDFLAPVPDLAALVTVDVVHVHSESWMYTDRAACCLAFRTTVNQAREQPYCSACPILPAATTQELFGRATAAYAARFPRPSVPG